MRAMPKKFGNKGSSLIMVVIGAAFLGILGALILSITYANINLKTANNHSKKNFYTEEVAVNEITAKLEEYSALSMTKAYTWLVKNYPAESVDINKCYDEYKKRYMIALSQMLHGTPSEETDVAIKYDINKIRDGIASFKKEFSEPTRVIVSVYNSAGATAGDIEHSKDADGNNTYDSLTIKNLSITYTEASGYETNIVTDIVMDFPIPGGVDTSFAKFALISDQLIDCTSIVNVTGGVYAGETPAKASGVGDKVNPDVGGILVQNNSGNLTINGNGNIVATRGNITAYSYGKLLINNAKVWAKNIRTYGAGDPVNFTPRIEIDAVTKVQDDLIMKAPFSTISLRNSYYGFSYKSKSGLSGKTTSDTSSSITINAKDVGLDMTGLNNLVLFGRAFVSSSDTGDSAPAASTSPSDTLMDIMTGQSIGVKYDQGAYLVPNESFLKIPSNPIDQDSIQVYAKDLHEHDATYDPSAPHLSLRMKDDIVDFTKGKAAIIHKWLDPDMPIRPIYYKQGPESSSIKMVNFYWNFKDEASANAYFNWYYDQHGGELRSTYKDFYRSLGGGYYNFKFKVDPFKRLQVAGSLLYQDSATGTFHIEKGEIKNMAKESEQLTTDYKSVQLNLREDGSTTKVVKDNPYVDTHFNLKEAKAHPTIIEHTGIKSNKFNQDATITITNADTYEIDSDMAGLIIATGDVKVSTARFEGLIVADGKIMLSTNSNIYADEKMILDLLNYCQSKGLLLKNYIYGYDSSSTGVAGDDSINFGDAIAFENWKKNA